TSSRGAAQVLQPLLDCSLAAQCLKLLERALVTQAGLARDTGDAIDHALSALDVGCSPVERGTIGRAPGCRRRAAGLFEAAQPILRFAPTRPHGIDHAVE